MLLTFLSILKIAHPSKNVKFYKLIFIAAKVGLPISQHLITNMGGRIKVSS